MPPLALGGYMEESVICGLRCLVRYPDNFDKSKKYPVLLHLHGAGSRGSDINKLKENQIWPHVEKQNPPCVIFSPQCEAETVWFDHFERLKDFAKAILEFDFVDRDRYYLMGTSMGGYATWQLAMSLNTIFAAVLPICGGGMYWNSGRLKDTNLWAFHGEDDPVVRCEESVKMVNGINKRGGHAKLTVYPGTNHNAWDPTYSNPEVWEWMLSQRLGKKEALEDETASMDSKNFG